MHNIAIYIAYSLLAHSAYYPMHIVTYPAPALATRTYSDIILVSGIGRTVLS